MIQHAVSKQTAVQYCRTRVGAIVRIHSFIHRLLRIKAAHKSSTKTYKVQLYKNVKNMKQ